MGLEERHKIKKTNCLEQKKFLLAFAKTILASSRSAILTPLLLAPSSPLHPLLHSLLRTLCSGVSEERVLGRDGPLNEQFFNGLVAGGGGHPLGEGRREARQGDFDVGAADFLYRLASETTGE